MIDLLIPSVIYALLLFPAMASIRTGMQCGAAPPRRGD